MLEDRFLKRLHKKSRKGMRGWPVATVAFYGPNLSRASKVAVGIVPAENADVTAMRDWTRYRELSAECADLLDHVPGKAISPVPKLTDRAPLAFVVDALLVRAADDAAGHHHR